MHEGMSHGKGVKCPKEKMIVPGRLIEELKEKPNTDLLEYIEKLRKWRC